MNTSKEVKQLQEFVETIYKGLELPVFFINVDEHQEVRFGGLNPAHEKLSGMKSEEIKGKTPEEIVPLVPMKVAKAVRANYERCLKERKAIQYEEMIPVFGKETFWLTTLTPIKNENGRITKIVGTAISINELKKTQRELENHKLLLEEKVKERTSELEESNEKLKNEIIVRKEAEERLKQSERKFHTLYDYSPDMYVSISPETAEIIECNNTFLDETGYTRKEIIGKPAFYVYHESIMPKVHEAFNEFVNKGIVKDKELILKRKDGSLLPVSLNVNSVKDDNGKIAYSISSWRDITYQKTYEEKLRKTLTDLERSNKELEQFAYVASHDLQEPLRMVASYTQLLEKRYKDKLDKDANDFIDFAVQGAHRMQKMINDLLQLSRVTIKGTTFDELNISLLLKEVLGSLETKIKERNAQIVIDKLPTIKGDETQIFCLFQNLIDNAIKYADKENAIINISGTIEDDEHIFSIKDNGIGIAPKYHEKIFEIFQRLNSVSEHGGTGIGLAICKKIVERHSGRIWVESSKEDGTVFYFSVKRF